MKHVFFFFFLNIILAVVLSREELAALEKKVPINSISLCLYFLKKKILVTIFLHFVRITFSLLDTEASQEWSYYKVRLRERASLGERDLQTQRP